MATETLVLPTKAPKIRYREVTKTKDGKIRVKLNFHDAQMRAWDSKKRFVFMLMGTQGGKTVFGCDWLHREIERTYNPDDDYNDYLIISATFPLLQKKVLPEFIKLFESTYKLGTYKAGDGIFVFKDKNIRVFFGSATNPQSIESATAKAIWMDECGQDEFKRSAWEAANRRLSIASGDDGSGRILGTTTLYNTGWLLQDIFKRWLNDDPDIDIIQADSIINPNFPQKEYERAKATLPDWKFAMFYQGQFRQPAGLIYDCFNERFQVIKPMEIPREWVTYCGMDFGINNTAVLWYSIDPTTGHIYLHKEYLAGGKSAAEHVEDLKAQSRDFNIIKIVGGSQTEDGWRESFQNAGWLVQKPIVKDVEVGIEKVYGFKKLKKLFVFDSCQGYLDENKTYSRELDDRYQPTNKISNKDRFHYMDAERYILSEFNPSWQYAGQVEIRRFYNGS